MSNLQLWVEKLGIKDVPAWLATPAADQVVAVLSVAMVLVSLGLAFHAFRSVRALAVPPTKLKTDHAEASPPRMLSDGRIVLGVTPQYLKRLYDENTSAEADKLSAKYIGNWIDLSGPFGDVTSPSPYYHSNPEIEQRMVVTFAFRREYRGPLVIMYFDAKSWQKYLEILVKNQKISVRCRIARIISTCVELEKCEFINPQTDKVIESEPQK